MLGDDRSESNRGGLEGESDLLLGEGGGTDKKNDATLSSTFSIASAEELAAEPAKRAGAFTVGLLIVADVVGSGILSLPSTYATLGWVLSVLFSIIFAGINALSGMYVYEAYKMHPHALSFSDLAYHTFGKAGRIAVGIITYVQIIFVLGAYMVSLAQTAAMVFYEYQICSVLWTLIAVVELIPLMQMRTLASLWFLLWLNLLFITVSVLIALVSFTIEGQAETLERVNGTTSVVANGITVYSFFGAMGSFAYAYVGCYIFVEILSEMKKHEEFPHALLGIATPTTLTYYLVVGCWGYAYLGSGGSGMFISDMPQGPAYIAAALFLHLHMLITFIVKGTILTRFFHRKFHLESINDEGYKGRLVYLGCSMLTVVLCFVIANLIPFFEDLVSLIGSLFIPFLGFLFPYMFVIKSRISHKKKTPVYEYIFFGVMTAFLICLLGFGTYSAISDIAAKWDSLGAPFSCNEGFE